MTVFTVRKYLSESEDQELRIALESAPKRDWLMITMLRRYGMRASELLALRKCDVDFGEDVMVVKGLKGSNDRQLPLMVSVRGALKGICENLESGESRVFDITYNRLGDIWRRYRPGGKPLHSLRHTLAIELQQKTRDVLIVKMVLGHRSIKSTMVYQEFCYAKETLREALV